MTMAILYICTGNYTVFWDDFFKTFEKYFLLEIEKEYFVFTDVLSLKGQETGRVHLFYTAWQPWPIPTLMKFHTFLSVEKHLRKFDYIYQPNSNARCLQKITAIDFLPKGGIFYCASRVLDNRELELSLLQKPKVSGICSV